MARYTGPKHKLCRREGIPLCGDPKCPVLTRPKPPGQHGGRRSRKLSDYGIRLREKQKAKRIYGVLERQFRRYVSDAERKTGKMGDVLLQLLETRLDNVLYRMGFAKTRQQARQLVTHAHTLVDSKPVSTPSYHVKPGQVVTLKQKILDNPAVKEAFEKSKENPLPTWLERKGTFGKVKRLPEREEIGEPINEQLIVEYYSR